VENSAIFPAIQTFIVLSALDDCQTREPAPTPGRGGIGVPMNISAGGRPWNRLGLRMDVPQSDRYD
jgi:hypothetical protein